MALPNYQSSGSVVFPRCQEEGESQQGEALGVSTIPSSAPFLAK